MNLFVLGVAATLALAPDMNDGSAFARQVATEYAGVTRGVVSFVVATQMDVRGGPVHRQELSETAYVDQDGTAVRKRVLKDVKNGKPLPPPDLDHLSRSEDGPLSRFGMRAPYALAALADYSFGKPHESGDLILVDFTSTVRDAAHGDGTLAYSRSAGRIDRVTYTPAALPSESGSIVLLSASLEITFGTVGSDRWDIVRIVRNYTGREGMMRGRGVATSIYDRYRVHANQAEAVAAVENPPG